jgi:signal transduction histidine kinase/ActR/RegA family two-component response regulator
MAGRELPLRKRLMAIMLLTSGTVLLLTCAGFLAYDAVTFRKTMVRELATVAAIIANNSTAVLAFNDSAGAEEILSALKAEPAINAAALYDPGGRIFSTYPVHSPREAFPAAPLPDGYRFEPSFLVGYQPVTQGNARLGTLFVKADLGAANARLRLYAVVAAAVGAVAFLLAYLLSRTLQRQITVPILALAETARAVSMRHDYSVRVRQRGSAELGLLTDAFNQMLTQIQEQLARMDLLNRVTRAIGERLDLSSVYQVMVRTLEDNLPMDFTAVFLHDSAAKSLTVSSVGSGSGRLADDLGMRPGNRVQPDGGILADCLGGAVAYAGDIATEDRPFLRRLAARGLRALFLAPLMVEGKVTGILLAARRDPEGFSALDRDFLRQLGEHAALAAHQAHLYGALQKAYDDLRLSQQSVMQQERLRALGQLASGIAHDINNAISPAALYTESLLETEKDLSPRAREKLRTVALAIGDVAATVSRMREFSRQRAQDAPLAPVQLNLALKQVVELTRARWQDISQQKGIVIQVRTELGPSLPEVMGVEAELREAFTNLFLNAFDAMPEGGTLTVRTRRAAGGGVIAEVADTGAGMDEETRKRCLEPFYTTKGERGTGLGLAMVYGVAQRHNADLEIDSVPGMGTTMRIVFPASAVAAPEPALPKPAPAARTPMRILVVDDDPLVARVLKDTMQLDGHMVSTADGGQAGIDAFLGSLRAGNPFEVVVTDLGMPYVDGSKVASAVKEASPVTPVILLTGWGQRLQAEGETPPNVDRVLGKPPKLADLREALASFAPVRR